MRGALAVALVAMLGCKSKRKDAPPPQAGRDAASEPDAIAKPWPELDGYPVIDAVRSFAVPSRQDVPRYDVGGPILVDDLAILASSQFGFLAVDWRTGQVAWSKPAGPHVAPPVRWGASLALVGDCLAPPAVPAGELLLGCLRVVTKTGADEAYLAIRGKPGTLGGFEDAVGPQALYAVGDTLRWTRGEAAVSIDPLTGLARRSAQGRPPIVVEHDGKRWDIEHVDGKLVATQDGKPSAAGSWKTDHEYTALLGVVHLHRMSPLVRFINVRMFGGQPQIHLHDMDATGSMHGTFARPLPGIALLGWAVSPIGDAALAVRMDTSLRRDFVAGYASTAQLLWVWPLPETPRADPVGVAVAEDAVVVFHDGDTLTILPEVSAPPTAPGAGGVPSDSATP